MLRLLLEAMTEKYNKLHRVYLQQSNLQLDSFDEVSNKGLILPRVLTLLKVSRVFVKADPKDNSLVSHNPHFFPSNFDFFLKSGC